MSMEYFNHIVNLHSMYFVSGSLADTAAVIRQAAASDAAAVNPEHAMAAAVIALAAGAVIYLYRHRRIKL